MSAHADIFDRKDPLTRWFAGSVVLHALVAASILSVSLFHGATEQWGDPQGGGMGSVAVNPVNSIPLPPHSGPVNPVANDTESAVPTPPPKAKPQPKALADDADAIALQGRTRKEKKHKEVAASPNKWRDQQHDVPNQLYSDVGPALSSPMFARHGGGGIGVGNDSPFGNQFGWYAKLLCDKVGQNWQTAGLDPRTTNTAVVTFVIRRDGSIAGTPRLTERSGNDALDISGQRAIMDAAPFSPLPSQFNKNEVEVRMRFSLK
ncbi:MAG: TonB C-terminal domain-containing protein [Bryobacteraceae bacterium]|jgi:protein TonB